MKRRSIDRLILEAKRMNTLYPLHTVMMAAALPFAAVYLIRHLSLKMTVLLIAEIIANITLMQSWIPNADFYFSLNSVSWYVSVALSLYFMFPVVLKKNTKWEGIIQYS